MRVLKAWILVAGSTLVLGSVSMGCFLVPYCENCETGATGGTGGASGTAGAGGSTTSSTTVDPGCIPSMIEAGMTVANDCGVFVSSSTGNDMNNGSKNAPFRTIAAALASAKKGPRYLCAETFDEPVKITANTTLYGGLDCDDDWKWIGKTTKSTIAPTMGGVPLTVDTQVSVTVDDVVFGATAAAEKGSSAIGIIADKDANLTLTRCDVNAGDAKEGADGTTPPEVVVAANNGLPGNLACSADKVLGGASVLNDCDPSEPDVRADQSLGGDGGNGTANSGAPGTPGTPGAMNGGTGESGGQDCTDGGDGDPGALGGPGAGGTALGSISKGGYAGDSGAVGGKGTPGQGGGGGGGAKGGHGDQKCPEGVSAGGASGGSGGAGGCGGNGGNGGLAGGSSIGIISLSAILTFTDVTITTGKGGNGGNGADGQKGGLGGMGGMGGSKPAAATDLKPGCAGGTGGTGGIGGTGGGGRGGHSFGIAYLGMEPTTDGATITVPSSSSMGGSGGNSGGNGAAPALLMKFD